jgi:hypothetical protein
VVLLLFKKDAATEHYWCTWFTFSKNFQCQGFALPSARYAAVNKPVILLSGVNHAQLSNGHQRSDSFDLAAELPLDEATGAVASVLADFLAVHTPDCRCYLELFMLSFSCCSVSGTYRCRCSFAFRHAWHDFCPPLGVAARSLGFLSQVCK